MEGIKNLYAFDKGCGFISKIESCRHCTTSSCLTKKSEFDQLATVRRKNLT